MIVMSMMMVAAPTYAEARRLPPALAGEQLLAGKVHAPIAAVEEPHDGNLPGVRTLELVERARATEQGCVRQRWTVRFTVSPAGTTPSDTSAPFAVTEIASAKPACRTAHWTHLNPGVDPATGFAALVQVRRAAGGRNVTLTCEDGTASALCTREGALRRALATLTPWAVTRDGADMLVWLGKPGGIVTEVRYDPLSPDRIIVRRSIPAPF